MSTQYGYFDDDARTYVITRPDTPTPWFNYIHHDQYTGLISHTGGGTSFRRDARHMRLLRYRFNSLPADRPGRYLYVRDDRDGHYWSATWAPVCTPTDQIDFRCHVGLGYQTVVVRHRNIESTVVYFVPDRGDCEIWWMQIRNIGRVTRRISTYSYAEFCMWSPLRDWSNMDAPPNTVRIERTSDNVILHSSYTDLGTSLETMNFIRLWGYFAASRRPCGYEINREDFIGRSRSEANPIVVETARNQRQKQPVGNPLGSFTHRFTLRASQTVDLVHILGICDKRTQHVGPVRRYRSLTNVAHALASLKSRWEKRLACCQAKTPDALFDALFNTFNPYQATMNFHLSRSLGPCYTGLGRGVGYRDTSQDCLAVISAMSDRVKEKLVLLMQNQLPDGTAQHGFFPLTGEGSGAGAFFDDHLWFILTLNELIRETGDSDFLLENVTFDGGGSGSVFEHIRRALDAAWRLRGQHGLCLSGKADWNDSLNPLPGSESPFTSMLFCRALADAVELAELIGQTRLARTWRRRYDDMRKRINRVAWDGKWYRRHLLPNGQLVGSRRRREGKIFLEPQVWSVLSGVATSKRALAAMDSVNKHLARPYGIKLQHPPFSHYDPDVGSAGIFRAGLKENGAVFNHTNPWAVIAECMLGRGDRAYDYLCRINPCYKNVDADAYVSEPYVYCQHVAAEPQPHQGRGRNSWLTGTASWSYVALSHYILGVRPDFDGLIIDPCIPSTWRNFKLTRQFRGATYVIGVTNPYRLCRGVKELTVDGTRIRGCRAPAFADGREHRVEVTLAGP